MKTSLFPLLTVLCMIISLTPTVSASAATSARAHVETQGAMIRGLIATFNDIPSWPGLDAHGRIYGQDPKSNILQPITANAWVGLHCVFPTAQPSQYPHLLGIHTSTPTSPVTAGQAAQWIVDWSVVARKMNLALEPISNPFQLLQDFSVFWSTGITSPDQVLTTAEAAAIRNNLVEACRGWRILEENRIAFLEPFITIGSTVRGREATSADIASASWGKWLQAVRYMNYASESALKSTSVFKKEGFTGGPYMKHWTLQDWPEVYSAITKLQNQSTLTILSSTRVRLSIESNQEYGLGSSIAWANAKGMGVSGWDQYQVNYWSPKALGWNHPILLQRGESYGLQMDHVQTGFRSPQGDFLLFYRTSPFTLYTDTYGGSVMESTGFEIVVRGSNIVAVNMQPLGYGSYWNTNYPSQVAWGV